MHPLTGTSRLCAAVKQPTSSESTVLPSPPPADVQLPVVGSTTLQYSKWPISSENAML